MYFTILSAIKRVSPMARSHKRYSASKSVVPAHNRKRHFSACAFCGGWCRSTTIRGKGETKHLSPVILSPSWRNAKEKASLCQEHY